MVIVVMGVSGAGKSTLARALADRLGARFEEGDAYHPVANVARMTAGLPLTDADRRPWLDALSRAVDAWLEAGDDVVLAASTLKRSYRRRLDRPGVRWVYLEAEPEAMRRRLEGREGHFMPPSLVDSQFEALEPPGPGEGAVVVDAEWTVGECVEAVAGALGVG